MKSVTRKHRGTRPLCISEQDAERVSSLLDSMRSPSGTLLARHHQELEEKLSEADVIPGPEMPGDVVTMNSEVTLTDVESGESLAVRLTYPSGAKPSENRISVLSPMGARLFGAKVGTTVEIEQAGVSKKYRIKSIVYQPEAARDFHR
ncbi:MAG TPA: GreA/GreB family elongation factor [Bryobacteraceae bacterium]|nr:GreA/GreB family elongation factor [Bryobacteraceae bacterium]HOQ43782.1 GreA/GreB family elongation factor [Bryobacteraceae bacterium]HPQ14892.1 GreA/GreB family elongation factor [Bryobacteraceae bacterium]HPU71775.1 GreA/GreB family elongation factor [Bryobacteraceae bacterium]